MFAARTRTVFKAGATASRRFLNTEKPFSKENIPFFGAVVGITALIFQVSVLYPWHEELSYQFASIENTVRRLESFSKTLDDKMDKVMALEEQVKLKERKILQREEEIIKIEVQVLERLENLTKIIQGQETKPQEGASN